MKSLDFQVNNLVFGYSEKSPKNRSPWNFSLQQGELVAILGPNGSGKTSLLRALMGDATYLAGEIRIQGESKSVEDWNSKTLARYFSYLPQESLFDSFQITEAFLKLAFFPQLGLVGRIPSKLLEGFDAFTEKFELRDYLNKRLSDLSSGERQRVFLARTLLQPSHIALLDEPTNHLDPNAIEETWSFLSKSKQGKIVVIATHDLAQVERHCDKVIVLSKSELFFFGTVLEYQSQGIKQKIFPLIVPQPC